MQIIELRNDQAEVRIAPELGGSVLAFSVVIGEQQRHLLRSVDQPVSVLDAGSFPLVPFSNRIRDGRFNWHGEQIILPANHLPEKHPNHGQGWQARWAVSSKLPQELVLCFDHVAGDWPFPYRAEQRFTLTGNTLQHTLSLTNTGDRDMPAGLGLHPFFNRTANTTLAAKVDKMWQVDDECLPTGLTNPPPALAETGGMMVNGSALDNAMTGFAHEASIFWPEWKTKAKITTSPNCHFLVIYSPDNASFFCAEPVTHCTDAFNLQAQGLSGTGAGRLAPGQKMEVWMRISPEVI